MMDTILEDYEFLDLSDASDFERSRIKRILVRPPSYDGCHRFQTPWNTTDAAAALTPNVAINAAPPPPYHGVQMNGGRAADNEDAARGGGGAAMYQGAAAAQPMMQPQLQQPQPPPRPVVQLNPQAGVFVNTQPFPSSAQYANYSPQTPEVVSARQPARGGGPAKAVNKRSGDVTASGHVGMAPPPPAPHVIWNSPPPMGAPHPHGYQFYTAAPPPPTPTAMVPAMIVGQFSPVAAYPPPLQQQHPLAPPPPSVIDEQELKEQQVPYNHHQHQHHHHHHALSQEHHHHQQQQHIQRHAPLPPLPHQHMQMPVTAPVTVTAPVPATVTQLPPRTAVQIMPPKFSNGHPVNSSNQLISNSSQSLQQKPPGAQQRVVVIATTITTTTIENSSAALPNLQKKPIAIASNTATVEAKTKAKPVAVKEEKPQQVGALNSASGGGGGSRVGEGEEKNVTKIVMTSSSSNDEQPIKQEVAKPASVVTEPSPKPNIAAVDQPPVAQQVKPVEVLPVTAPVTVPAPVTAPVIAAAPTFASLFSNSSSSPGAAKAQRYSAPPLQNHSTEHLASNVGARSSREYSSPNVASRQPVASSVNASSAAAGSTHAQKQSHSVNTPHHLSSSSSVSPLAGDPGLLRLAEYLSTYKLDHRAAILRPRGLTNRSNYCYINATLQALLACPPLYNLLKKLPLPPRKSHAASKSKTPIIDSMVQFVNEFEEMSNPSLLRSRREKQMARDDKHQQVEMEAAGAAFEPSYVYRMMNNVIRNESAFPVEGRQEDAEEFLSCLLNGLNDEMVELLRLTDDNISNGEVIATNGDNYLDQDSDNEWKEISKKKPTITRRTKLISTPLSQIFQGQWRSRVVRQGASETDNIQPFFTFPLDIEKAQSVKEALDNITTKNMLEGFTCPKTNRTIEAYQQLYLEELPLVLLLHLKCFDFRLQTCSKIIKNVEFSIELKIEPKLIASSGKNKNNNNNNNNNNRSASSSMKEREYKLFAVVYHDGKEATKGHYVTDVYHVGYGTWLRYDDANVRSVTQREVLAPKAPRVPYLLYYRRKDTIAPPPSQPSASASASAAASKPQKTAATES